MDRQILEKLKNERTKIQLVNNEFFIMKGRIIDVYDSSIAFYSDGKIRYLSFSRILEVRPLGGKQ